mmetsp:Transcript_51586/g.137689  ORF Transcript_51586/g.137689 Transcript_51586/m.137689 type:complete len:108 (+) Transcript_51586:915-1238(+)
MMHPDLEHQCNLRRGHGLTLPCRPPAVATLTSCTSRHTNVRHRFLRGQRSCQRVPHRHHTTKVARLRRLLVTMEGLTRSDIAQHHAASSQDDMLFYMMLLRLRHLFV